MRDDHAAYIGYWLKALKDNTRLILSAGPMRNARRANYNAKLPANWQFSKTALWDSGNAFYLYAGKPQPLKALLLAVRQCGKTARSYMKTVAILSQKGGTGKTTLALHLAVAAERAGETAAVIDLDPQASASGWSDARKGETPAVVPVPFARLTHALEAAKAGGASIAFIDTAPHASDAALASAEIADLVLIPCRPGILDLRAIGMTARAVKLAGVSAYVVLNAMPPRAPNVLADARAAVEIHGLEVAPVYTQQRAAYAHALIGGQTAQEYEPAGKASEEIGRLYTWMKSELEKTAAELPATRQLGITKAKRRA